ncbi:YfiT family bacillithiol transferase [Paenibacillus pabuli]|uniref:YfiT family bacillithiol transferase n=1 Tax=Paenibacillus pabuli TaxID=1472 RepID=UPI000785416F|nr:putative metal-dependent hydrolase [Paenibacillus pabuli]MEC0128200.1 putative metal-dependent hydrolase [Paenibacillus pabuli]
MNDSIRYPLGQFELVVQPTSIQRDKWINDIAEMPKILRCTVQDLTVDQLHIPYRQGGWTIRQIVHHLADNNMNAYIRFKKALTEDTPISTTYREDLWAELFDYKNEPIDTSLILIEALHHRFITLLRSLSSIEFSKQFISPTHGTMSLDAAIQRYVWHGQHHIEQINQLKRRMGWLSG